MKRDKELSTGSMISLSKTVISQDALSLLGATKQELKGLMLDRQ